MSRNTYGFTMVEVIIVLLILGIVSAVAIPSIKSSVDEMKLDGAVREVVSAIQYAQSLSIKEGKSFGVSVHVGQERIKCKEFAITEAVLHPIDKKPYEIKFNDYKNLQGVDIISVVFGASSSSVYFNSLGEPDKVGSIILGYGSFQKTINVTKPLGKVNVN
jgi:prepilin-type N-terminal cleavage/methylation domain-containing protein